jgi:hypothetical protein
MSIYPALHHGNGFIPNHPPVTSHHWPPRTHASPQPYAQVSPVVDERYPREDPYNYHERPVTHKSRKPSTNYDQHGYYGSAGGHGAPSPGSSPSYEGRKASSGGGPESPSAGFGSITEFFKDGSGGEYIGLWSRR